MGLIGFPSEGDLIERVIKYILITHENSAIIAFSFSEKPLKNPEIQKI
jgi:hypothetical protein